MDTESAREMIARNYRPGPVPKEEDMAHDDLQDMIQINLDLIAERDRLAAENAELLQACDDFSKELSVQYQLELEAKCHDDLEKSHAIMVQVVAERDAELAAANATLDRLREVVPENDIRCPLCDSINSRYWGHGQWLCMGCEKKFGPFILIDKIRRAIYPPEIEK